MINGMSEICIDCVHKEVCKYECYCPSGHCNDYAVADDFIPQGEWINQFIGGNECVMCSECKLHFDIGTNFCPNCGADMRGEE